MLRDRKKRHQHKRGKRTPLNIIRMTFLFFLNNFTVVLCFLTLYDKHNIRTLSENIKFICTLCETGQKSSQKVLAFLSVSKQTLENTEEAIKNRLSGETDNIGYKR